jgi:phage terminase large subunit GpA-like protein
MLAPTEPGVHIITAQVATQLLKTSLLENVFGYHAHLDPCPMLLVQPKEDAATQFSKERIEPLIRATPVLKGLIGSSKTRSADDTLLYKAFPGGFLALVGAGSPDNLARRPVRIVAYDEIDKYPALTEGDPLDIGDERMATFPANWLSIRVCSPTIEDESRINASYMASDRRKASVPCPHCGHRQFLDFFKHVHWEKDADGEHKPKTAAVYCDACGAAWSEGQRLLALKQIQWHQTRPFTCCGEVQKPIDLYDQAWRAGVDAPVATVWDWWQAPRYAVHRARCKTCGIWAVENEHAGFQAGKLYSPWSARDGPPALAKKWLAARKDDAKRQVFFNTQLAEVYRVQSGKEVELDVLKSRREVYGAEVPDGVAVLTVGADVQDYRVEIEVVGWGRDQESWSLQYEVIEGQFSDLATQKALDEFLKRTWRRADGRPFQVSAGCIDTGGHHTQAVYSFVKERLGRKIWGVKGASEINGQRSPVWPTKKLTSRSKRTFRPIIIGVNAAKDVVSGSLNVEHPGPGYMHFPADYDHGYFEQLTAERLIPERIGGRIVRKWVQKPGRANEALDCRVYAYAALCGLVYMNLRLNRRADEVGAAKTPEAPQAGPVIPRPMIAGVKQAPGAPAKPSDPDQSREARRARRISRLA